MLVGLTHVVAAALGRYRSAFALGAWLVIVGTSCAWLAPATILATCALAVGGAFLLIAAIETGLRQGSGVTARTSVSLSQQGRKAWDNYTAVLRQLLDSASTSEAAGPH